MMKKLLTLLLLLLSVRSFSQTTQVFDLVISGGRVIDPETKLDAIRNIGIINNRIVTISTESLKGKETIKADGLVVSPGFIDLHVHGVTNKEQEYQLHDGLTTALELEWGVAFIDEWYASRNGKALINYGASVCWPFERVRAMDSFQQQIIQVKQNLENGKTGVGAITDAIQPTLYQSQNADQTSRTIPIVKQSLNSGAIGIGIPIAYVPGAKPEEVFQLYKFAGETQTLIFSHVREGGIMAVQQVIADAMLTNAPLHIVHVNSSTLGSIALGIELVRSAHAKGYSITTELYPYPAASTDIKSALFDEGWQKRLGISYGDLQWVATGERLTKETFEAYRETGGILIIHSMKPEWIKSGVSSQGVIIASDGMNYSPLAHPRTAGTFSRLLGKYVREEKAIDLHTALEKITILPAKRLEIISPMMRFKGRLQVGADADITIFNPDKIIDRATFDKGLAFSEGVEWVIVNGVIVLKNGKTVDKVYPGQPVYGKFKQ